MQEFICYYLHSYHFLCTDHPIKCTIFFIIESTIFFWVYNILHNCAYHYQVFFDNQAKKPHQQFTARGPALFFSSKVFFQLFSPHWKYVSFALIFSCSRPLSFYFSIHFLVVFLLPTFTFYKWQDNIAFTFCTRWRDCRVWVQGPVHLWDWISDTRFPHSLWRDAPLRKLGSSGENSQTGKGG